MTDVHRLCRIEEIPEGEGRPFEVTRAGGEPLRVVVVKHRGSLHAYENRCAHFGVRLDATPGYPFIDEGHIVCQVHYARYGVSDGHCVRGDCDGEGLRPLTVGEEAGWIVLRADAG